MDPAGQGFKFSFTIKYIVCDVSGSIQTGKKKLWEIFSIICLHLGKRVIEFLVTKGLLGTNSYFLIFVKIGKCVWRL